MLTISQFSDAARLLSFYQLWLDDLFPKAKFLDALAMVEKTGHKTSMHKMRTEWINEGKPKPANAEPEEQPSRPTPAPAPTRMAPIFENFPGRQPQTPPADDQFGGEDFYNATPKAQVPARPSRSIAGGEEPDEEDLDALMAEAEAQRNPPPPQLGLGETGATNGAEPEALLVEAGPERVARKRGATPKPPTSREPDDDLDALVAEAEAEAGTGLQTVSLQAPQKESFADDEEAMAEMEGLW